MTLHLQAKFNHLDLSQHLDSIKAENTVYPIGEGGGEHHVVTQSTPYTYNDAYDEIINKMLKFLPTDIKVQDYSLEHRKYIFKSSDEAFVGEKHDDCSEFTIIWYYRIDSGIKSNGLKIGGSIVSIAENDILVFSGTHQVLKLHGCGERNIISVFVNGHP
jgi:hypothetical protein